MLGCGGEAGFSFNCRGYRKLAGASSFPARLLIMVHLLPWPPLAPSVMSSCCCLRADPSWARIKLFTAPPSSPSTHECGREFSACVGGPLQPQDPAQHPPRAGTSKSWWNRSIYIHGPLSVMHYPAHSLYALLLWKGVFIFEDFYNQVAQTGWLRQKLSHSSGGHKTEKDPMMLFWVQKPPCVPCL